MFEAIDTGLKEVGSFFKTIFDGVVEVVTAVIDTMLARFISFFNTITSGLNGIIGLANSALGVLKTVSGGTLDFAILPFPKIKMPKQKAPAPARIPKLALGGIVMPRPGGVLANIAEAGQPEAVIPLSKMGQFTNNRPTNVFNITVSGGLDSSASIGQAVIESIKAYERTSGPIFAKA